MQLEKIYKSKCYIKSLATIGFLAVLLVGCKSDTKADVDGNTKFCIDQKLKKELQTSKVELMPIEESITLTGEIETNSDNTVKYASMVDGLVTNTYFSLGDYVKKGQLLAEIQSTSLNEMQDDTQSLRAQLVVAKRKLEAVRSMYKDEIASQKDLIEAQSEVAIIESNIAKTGKNMQLYSAHKNKLQVKAPASGYVIEKNISQGMSVSAGGDNLFVISNLDNVWVMANVYATNMRHVYANQTAVVSTLAYPGENFFGKVNSISQVFDENERVLKAKIVLDNKDKKLKPGMSADIMFPVQTSGKSALAIPVKALIFDNNQNYVVVYKADCDMEIRLVTEISANSNYTYVEGNLKPGESIITNNALLIYDALKAQSN